MRSVEARSARVKEKGWGVVGRRDEREIRGGVGGDRRWVAARRGVEVADALRHRSSLSLSLSLGIGIRRVREISGGPQIYPSHPKSICLHASFP